MHGEKVLTPSGFVNIEDIRVGDKVVTPNNTIEIVENVWPQGVVDIYEVITQDGRSVKACGEHLWQYHIAGKKTEWCKVSNTLEVKELIDSGKTVVIPDVAPLSLPNKSELLYDPYSYGKKAAHNEQIDEEYIYSLIEYRWELVRGLFDSRGYIDKRGVCFTSLNKKFLDDIRFVLHSLGFLVKVVEVNGVYTLIVFGENIDKLFTTKPKQRIIKMVNAITDIKYVGKGEATCIAVSGKDKLFVTNNFIVTHNSTVCLTKNLDGVNDPNFVAVILRRSQPELKRPGGLLRESNTIYPHFKGKFGIQSLTWKFPAGAQITFGAIGGDHDLGGWQGSQLTRVMIDEAGEQWTQHQVLFMLSRMRSKSKIHPQLIMTANPNKESFLFEWVKYCLDADGIPIKGTENIIRWFTVEENKAKWADSAEECYELYGKPKGKIMGLGLSDDEVAKIPPDLLFIPKSFRFIPMGVYDNPYLLPPRNTTYLANLLSQPRVNQLRFLHGF